MHDFRYLKMHEIHQLGDLWFQDLHCLFIDLYSIGLLIAFHLRQSIIFLLFLTANMTLICKTWKDCRRIDFKAGNCSHL